MKKLIIIDRGQYGILIDTYKYCQHLADRFYITYFCFKEKEDMPILKNGKVIRIHRFSNKYLNGLYFLIRATLYLTSHRGFVFVVYYPTCSWLKKVLPWRKMHVDIRTLSVSKDESTRVSSDNKLKSEIQHFNSISYISEGVKEKLGLTKNVKKFFLPLGADILSSSDKDFDTIKLLYVGTLNNRRIIDTIKGLKMFVDKTNVAVSYDIVGGGDELEEITKYVQKNNMSNYVHLYGRLPYSNISSFFDNSNVGVSYIPLYDCYQDQPPTKTFEYILSGLYCIATKTRANSAVINNNNGLLIDDDPASFASALDFLYINTKKMNSRIIRNSMKDCQWAEIVDKYFLPIVSE